MTFNTLLFSFVILLLNIKTALSDIKIFNDQNHAHAIVYATGCANPNNFDNRWQGGNFYSRDGDGAPAFREYYLDHFLFSSFSRSGYERTHGSGFFAVPIDPQPTDNYRPHTVGPCVINYYRCPQGIRQITRQGCNLDRLQIYSSDFFRRLFDYIGYNETTRENIVTNFQEISDAIEEVESDIAEASGDRKTSLEGYRQGLLEELDQIIESNNQMIDHLNNLELNLGFFQTRSGRRGLRRIGFNHRDSSILNQNNIHYLSYDSEGATALWTLFR